MAESTGANKSTGSNGGAKGAADAVTGAVNEAVTRGQEAFEATETRIRELNDQIIDAAKKTGSTSLDTYEKALTSILEY